MRGETNLWWFMKAFTAKLMNSVKRNASLIIGGILVGLLLLQPFALFIFWLQFRKALGHELTDWLLDNLDDTLTRQGLFQADLAYMAFGIFITLTINYFSQKQNARKKEVQALENHIAASLPNLIKKGESENLEFKSIIQIQNLSQRGINLDGIKIIYEMKDKIEELQNKIIYLEDEITNQKIDSKNKEKEIHQSYKNEIVKKSNNSLKKNI